MPALATPSAAAAAFSDNVDDAGRIATAKPLGTWPVQLRSAALTRYNKLFDPELRLRSRY